MPNQISKATIDGGNLIPIEDCYIIIPSIGPIQAREIQPRSTKITMNILPDISDRKSVNYADESGIGRSMPFKSFQSSENRSISWTIHWIVCKETDSNQILSWLRLIEACTYPVQRSNLPYTPPPICQIRCGNLLSSDSAGPIYAILKDYSVKFDTSVPWDEKNLLPSKLDVDLNFDVVYNMDNLPFADKILRDGY